VVRLDWSNFMRIFPGLHWWCCLGWELLSKSMPWDQELLIM